MEKIYIVNKQYLRYQLKIKNYRKTKVEKTDTPWILSMNRFNELQKQAEEKCIVVFIEEN